MNPRRKKQRRHARLKKWQENNQSAMVEETATPEPAPEPEPVMEAYKAPEKKPAAKKSATKKSAVKTSATKFNKE